jgi:hypothetical protein
MNRQPQHQQPEPTTENHVTERKVESAPQWVKDLINSDVAHVSNPVVSVRCQRPRWELTYENGRVEVVDNAALFDVAFESTEHEETVRGCGYSDTDYYFTGLAKGRLMAKPESNRGEREAITFNPTVGHFHCKRNGQRITGAEWLILSQGCKASVLGVLKHD